MTEQGRKLPVKRRSSKGLPPPSDSGSNVIHFHTAVKKSFSYEEKLYFVCAVLARRVMLPCTQGFGNRNISGHRHNLWLIEDETDDKFPYLSLYYDYTTDPMICLTMWKVLGTWQSRRTDFEYIQLDKAKKSPRHAFYKSIFYTSDGDPYLEKDSPCLIDGIFAKSGKILEDWINESRQNLFHELTYGGVNRKHQNVVSITQLLWKRHCDYAKEIMGTWDQDNYVITAMGPDQGGHPGFDWDYISNLRDRFAHNLLRIDSSELRSSCQVGIR